MTTETITLTNDFHGTEARVRVSLPSGRISAAQAKRAARKLCRHDDCTCGQDVLNRRGIQPVGAPKRIEAMYSAQTGQLLYVEFPGMRR